MPSLPHRYLIPEGGGALMKSFYLERSTPKSLTLRIVQMRVSVLLSTERRNFFSECWVRHLSMGISECH